MAAHGGAWRRMAALAVAADRGGAVRAGATRRPAGARGGRARGALPGPWHIANLITLFAFEAIVLSGSVMESADLFMPVIREVVCTNCTQVPASQVELTVLTLGNEAPLNGAAAAWRHRYPGGTRPC